MKKVLLTICCFLAGLGAMQAQNIQFEAVAGINISDMTHLDSKTGIHLGVRATEMLTTESNSAYVNAALLLSLKGSQLDYGNLIEVEFNAYYFEVPIHVGYKYTINDKVALFGEFGPYVAIGAFGRSKVADSSTSIKCDTFGEVGGVKRLDAGMGFRVGVEIEKRVPISIGYDFGLLDISDGDGETIKNTNFCISVGYKF